MVPKLTDTQKRIVAAEGYLMLGMARQAIDELNRVSGGRDRDWHALQAEARAMQGEFAAAVEHYRAALKTDSGEVSLSVALARCLVRLGMTDAGLRALEAAYEAHPDEPELYYELARHYALVGDKVLALSWLGRAIRQSQEYRQRAADDAEFQQLRRDPDFEFLVQNAAESW
jgi:predicted Zn-dependent protease